MAEEIKSTPLKNNRLEEERKSEQNRTNQIIAAINKAFSNPNKLKKITGEEKSFDELLKYSDSFGTNNWGVVQRNKGLQDQLKKELEERGIRKMTFVDSGDEAVIFSTTQGQMLRISNSKSQEPQEAKTAGVVPVIDSFSLKAKDSIFGKQWVHTQVTPEITMANEKDSLSKKDLADARRDISRTGLADGVLISDLQGVKNIGFYDNGTPVNPDLGSAYELQTLGKSVSKVITKVLDIKNPDKGPTKTKEKLEHARDEHLQNRGLEIGEIKGTFPKKDMDELRASAEENSHATKIMEELIEKRGMYKDDMAELLAKVYGDNITKDDLKQMVQAQEEKNKPASDKTDKKLTHLERYISEENNQHSR